MKNTVFSGIRSNFRKIQPSPVYRRILPKNWKLGTDWAADKFLVWLWSV